MTRRWTLAGKTVLLTGGTSGLGRAAADPMATAGAHLVILGRSADRNEAAAAELRAATGGSVEHLVCDLGSLESVAAAADEYRERFDDLDVLVNNAGGIYRLRRTESVDGNELTMAVNHLGHFALTIRLIDIIRASAPARIVNVTSDAHVWARDGFSPESWDPSGGFATHRRYGMSKLANLLFTHELARRLEGDDVLVNATTPDGLTATDFAKNINPVSRGAMWVVGRFARSPEKGASGIVRLATDPDLTVSGAYFVEQEPATPSPHATDDEAAAALWRMSVERTGVDLPERTR